MSERLVIDAGVAVQWYLPEPLSQQADALLAYAVAHEVTLAAPDLIYCDVANALWKRIRLGTMAPTEGRTLLAEFMQLPIKRIPGHALAAVALQLAGETGRTVYDSSYLALAVELKSKMVTADQRLVNAVANTTYAEHIEWLGDWLAPTDSVR